MLHSILFHYYLIICPFFKEEAQDQHDEFRIVQQASAHLVYIFIPRIKKKGNVFLSFDIIKYYYMFSCLNLFRTIHNTHI